MNFLVQLIIISHIPHSESGGLSQDVIVNNLTNTKFANFCG